MIEYKIWNEFSLVELLSNKKIFLLNRDFLLYKNKYLEKSIKIIEKINQMMEINLYQKQNNKFIKEEIDMKIINALEDSLELKIGNQILEIPIGLINYLQKKDINPYLIPFLIVYLEYYYNDFINITKSNYIYILIIILNFIQIKKNKNNCLIIYLHKNKIQTINFNYKKINIKKYFEQYLDQIQFQNQNLILLYYIVKKIFKDQK